MNIVPQDKIAFMGCQLPNIVKRSVFNNPCLLGPGGNIELKFKVSSFHRPGSNTVIEYWVNVTLTLIALTK
jgi:hypothetical protein